MIPMRMASIGGFQGPRGSLFRGSTTDTFNLGSPSLGVERSPENYYNYAKSEINQYDGYLVRAKKVANQEAREELVKDYYGDPADPDSASYRRNSVEANVKQAEAYTPTNYLVFAEDRVQSRVEKLNDWNKDFKEDLEEAERMYGSLPNPVQVQVEVEKVPGWVMPVVIGAAAVAALSALGVFSKK